MHYDWGRIPKLCIGKGRQVINYNSVYGVRGQQCTRLDYIKHAMQLHVHSACKVCALESSSIRKE